MKANSQVIARARACVDYESEESDSHISTFNGIKTGLIISIILFWLPFIIISYLFGWFYLFAYGVLLFAAFISAGFVSRYSGLLRSILHLKSSAEALGP